MKSLILVVAVIFLTMVAGCAGTNYLEPTTLDDGTMVVQGGRTGAFGTDNSFVYIQPPAPQITTPVLTAPAPSQEPQKVLVERTYTKSSTAWTGCPDAKPNKRAKNVRRQEVQEKWTEEEIIPPVPAAPAPTPIVINREAYFYAGSNASTGNMAMPAALIGGAMVGASAVHRPDRTNIDTSASGGQATGGSATGGSGGQGGAGGIGGNSTAYGGEGGAGGNSTAYGGEGGQGGNGYGGAGGSSKAVALGGNAESKSFSNSESKSFSSSKSKSYSDAYSKSSGGKDKKKDCGGW